MVQLRFPGIRLKLLPGFFCIQESKLSILENKTIAHAQFLQMALNFCSKVLCQSSNLGKLRSYNLRKFYYSASEINTFQK